MDANILEYRKATAGDLQALYELYNGVGAWLHETKGITDQWDRTIPEEEIGELIDSRMAYVATLGPDLAAVLKITDCDGIPWNDDGTDNAYYVHSFAVHRNYVGMGIGTQVLDWVTTLASRDGRRCVRLDCMAANPRLCRYYADAGFRALGQHPHYAWYALFEKQVA